ncbi:MAG: hypothetical protein AAB393_02670, partial [Bacteroidota bacterium]
MVSLLRSIQSYFHHHVFDALFVTGAFLVVLLFLIYPQAVVGSVAVPPEPAYAQLLSLLSDTTEETKGHPPVKGDRPAGEGKGEFDPARIFEQSDSSRTDTSAVKEKARTDSSYVVYEDSTYRLRHFSYMRRDRPYVEFFPDRVHPLFAVGRPASFQRHVAIDSTGKEFRFSESVGGENVKVPLSLSLHDYITQRRRTEQRKILAEEARKPKALAQKNDLGELLSSITKIEIPIPPNPLLSIFGGKSINLNISGAVDIKAGFRNTKSDQTQISRLDQSRNEPDFQQEVQVNVNGTIG